MAELRGVMARIDADSLLQQISEELPCGEDLGITYLTKGISTL